MKAVIRQVKSLSMSCDRVGNLLLAKFSNHGAADVCIFIPAEIVFWLLRHLPVNQDPQLQAPPPPPPIQQRDWDSPTPRALLVNCKELPGILRMTFQLDRKPDLTVVLDRSNVELMRQIMAAYSNDLIDLDAA
ncbi:MAG: hypothetical protein ACJ8LG_16225 [Massilia sp.]